MIHSIGGDGVICLHDKFLAEKIIFPPMVDVEECEHDFLVIIVCSGLEVQFTRLEKFLRLQCELLPRSTSKECDCPPNKDHLVL